MIVEPLRSKRCLYGFRCGKREIDGFSKSAHRKHFNTLPDCRVRVLYDGDTAVGMYALSMSNPSENGRVLDKKSVYAGTQVFLYIDYLGIHLERQKTDLSYQLMTDLIETLKKTMETFGLVFAVALNAIDDEAKRFFKKNGASWQLRIALIRLWLWIDSLFLFHGARLKKRNPDSYHADRGNSGPLARSIRQDISRLLPHLLGPRPRPLEPV